MTFGVGRKLFTKSSATCGEQKREEIVEREACNTREGGVERTRGSVVVLRLVQRGKHLSSLQQFHDWQMMANAAVGPFLATFDDVE